MDDLAADLRDGSVDERREAVETFGEMGDAEAVSLLPTALVDRDATVRQAAADTLLGAGDTAVEPLIAALGVNTGVEIDDGEYVFLPEEAGRILVSLGEPAVEPLIAALGGEGTGSGSAAGTAYVVGALGRIGDPRALEALLAARGDGEGSAGTALKAIASLGDERCVEPLLAALETDHPGVRNDAAEALGAMGTVAVTPLTHLLDQDVAAGTTLEAVVHALGETKDPEAVGPLIDLLHRDIDDDLRGRAVRALGTIGTPAVGPLGALLDDSGRARRSAAEALRRTGSSEAVPPLAEHVEELYATGDVTEGAWVVGLLMDLGEEVEGKDALIRIERSLTRVLRAHGDVELAQMLLNSGNRQLAATARRWAEDNGYSVMPILGNDGRSSWGSG